MKRHSLLGLLRLVLAIPIAYAMPMSHSYWGLPYPGDGQQAFGFIIIFGVISLVAALVFIFIGTGTQFFLRRRRPYYTVIADLILFALFTGLLVYAGVSAEYTDIVA
ncbi:hypothetical protein BH11VER1_BH11VER1_15470 [soil metagenome]